MRGFNGCILMRENKNVANVNYYAVIPRLRAGRRISDRIIRLCVAKAAVTGKSRYVYESVLLVIILVLGLIVIVEIFADLFNFAARTRSDPDGSAAF